VPLQYVSRTIRESERNRHISEKEMLSLMFCLSAFRPFIASKRFTIRTDSISLTYLKNPKDPLKSRVARWALKLNEFDYVIMHLVGRLNKMAN
jgi:hypothetical protein